MREIVLDTETTGFTPADGDRIIEIGAVELINHIPTGKTYHQYINPERDVPIESQNVHGLTDKFLADKPIFSEIVTDFLAFIGNDTLVIHNAEFDMNFINYQLRHGGFPTLKNRIVDTLLIARAKFPGSPANLDALCRRFEIDNSNRTLHGALLDSELLAEVYMELLGGRQHGLGIAEELEISQSNAKNNIKRPFRAPRDFPVPEQDLTAHEKMLGKLKNHIWNQ